MTPHEFAVASILARMLVLEDTSRCPDVQELREVAREILAEQLRELEEPVEPPVVPSPRNNDLPRTG